MAIHRFFVLIPGGNGLDLVQEISPKLFSFLQKLPQTDPIVKEPNLLELQRYPVNGLHIKTDEIRVFYAGVAKLPDNSLTIQNHYFLVLKPSKFKPMKKASYLLEDLSLTNQQKTQNGDSQKKT